jgi:outer membrane protein OmpA-like peptidoglycan-associated protein
VQIPRYAKTVLALTISAAFSACALQTERSSSGPGTIGRTTAPPAPEYEPAQYSSPPDYETAQYAEPAAVAAAEPEEPELEEEEELEEELFEEEEPVAMAEPEVTQAPEAEMPQFTEEMEVEEELAEEAFAPIAAAAPAGVVEEPEMAQEEEAEEEPEEEEVAEEEEPVAAGEEAEPAAFVAAPVMPAFVAEEEEPAEEVAEQFQPIAPAEEESTMTYAEEPGVAPDDGIVAQQEYYEEEEGVLADDGIVGQSQYYDEEEGAQPADLISEPQQSDEVMATEVAQEPTPVVLPVTITLEAEPWFDFDRSAVRSDGRAKLEELVAGLNGVEYDTILVVGHADRIGTNSYNQTLSLRRANSVRTYLAERGVPVDRIRTEGRGEFEPSTDPNTCTGMRKRSLIDCLQPDRRVEVTVTGQRMP